MPTTKPDPTLFSITGLSTLTGRDRRTIVKALGGLAPVRCSGRAKLYASREALERIYRGKVLDLTAERARLAREQADGQQLKNALQREEQIPADLVVSTWQQMILAAKTTFRGVRSKLRMRFPDLPRDVLEAIGDVHDEALGELASDGLPASTREDGGGRDRRRRRTNV